MNHPNIPKHNPNAIIHSLGDFVRVKRSVEKLIVDRNACNNKDGIVLDLSSFSNLKVFEVGDYSFAYVKEVKLIGMSQLERVVIGRKCFTEKSDCGCCCPDSHFHLKNCERLRELRIGHTSFDEYSVCEIGNLPSLEVIEMGELSEASGNFKWASLELTSDYDEMK